MRVFRERPAMGKVYLRALMERGGALAEGVTLPSMRSRLEAQVLEEEHLAAYRAACGAKAEVPVAYPQLLVTGLHVSLLTEPEFPIRAMGLIHPRFAITQHRPLRVGEALRFECWFDGQREVKSGVEFDIETRAYVGDELVWESTAATFHRTRRSESGRSVAESEPWEERRPFPVPADAGRRYARVSGDANPVHLHPLVSRLFGYKRPIAHGWWLVARSLAELGLETPAGTAHFEFEFRRPVVLGTAYTLASIPGDEQLTFAVLDESDKVRLRAIASGDFHAHP